MPDYKRAWNIVKDNFNVFTDNWNGCELIIETKPVSYCSDVDGVAINITKEEQNCLNECLNAEPDTMDKIIEEFKRNGYKVNVQNERYIILENKFLEVSPQKIFIDIESKFITFENCCGLIIKDLQLINRIYRLWGVEI